jgi:DMSO/TMAO reductase YedYZ heme-binding membrane subunit
LSEFARKAGTLSALCYLGTLVPGMLKRLGIFPLMRASMMLFRRQLGVLMFWLAILHQSMMVTFPMLITYGGLNLAVYGRHEVYGLLGVGLLFPLWVTSNDSSVRRLGKLWHWIHALTYIALFFIYLHVSDHEGYLPWLFKGVVGLEIISWLYYMVQSKRKQVINAPTV